MNVRSASMTLFARIIAMIGPICVSIITARALGAEGRGLYFLVITYAQIAAQFGNLGLHSSNTYLVAAHPERRSAILANSIVVASIGGVLATVPIIAWFGLTDDDTSAAIRYTYLLAPLLVMFLLITNIAVAIGQVQLFNALTILSGALALTCAFLAALFDAGTEQFLWAAIIAIFSASVVGIIALLPHCDWRLRLDFSLLRKGFGYGTRAYLATLAGFLMNRTGVMVLQSQGNLEVVGQFSIAQQIVDALILLPSTVGLLLKPALLRMSNSADRVSTMWRTACILSAIMFVMLAIIGILTPTIVPLVFGIEYQAAVPLVLTFLPSALLMSFIIVVSQFLSAEGFPIAQTVTWFVATAFHIVLSMLLLPEYGALAISISYGITSVLVLASLIHIAHRLSKNAESAEITSS